MAVKGSLCNNKRVEGSLVLTGECDWLIWIVLWAKKDLKASVKG